MSHRDEAAVARLIAEARTMRLGRADFWATFLPELNAVLRAHVPAAYALEVGEQAPRVEFLEMPHASLGAQELRELMNAGFARQPTSFVGYSPVRPEPKQRNRALLMKEIAVGKTPGAVTSMWKHIGAGHQDQVRVLVCEGEAMLAWVGAFRPDDEPFGERERAILQRLTPALQRRLTLERQLNGAPLARAALEACIESLARPAMIINHRGEAQFANTLARRELAADARGTLEQLRACLAGTSRAFALTPLVADGLPAHWLAVQSPAARDPAPLLASAKERWSLTAREVQALALLAEGLSNRAIAVQLACAERTVEVHVARLLAKSGSESRSQLIARFWSDGRLEKELGKPHVRT